MSSYRNQSQWQAPEPFLWHFIRRNVPILLFLLLATAGMGTVYWFFTPPADGSAQAVAAAGEGDSLSAVIQKSAPAPPVTQRFAQSSGPLGVALIAGHQGNDAGAVCQDGLTEAQVNATIAQKVVEQLRQEGIRADTMAEFDPRIQNYSGTALVSIHADSCDYVNDLATGFKISGSAFTDSSTLSTCIEQAYQAATHLPFHANTITADMTDYHAFREIAPGVPAIIIETGFMNLDRDLLTTQAELPAAGIANGILCFLQQSGYWEKSE